MLELPPSPTTDYYIRPRAAHSPLEVSYRSILQPPQPGDLLPGTGVIIVRYLGERWSRALQAQAHDLAGVVHVMDDDLLDPTAWWGLPLGYQWRLWRHAQVLWPALRCLASAYWMSTPALVARYAHLGARWLPPLPLVSDEQRTAVAQAVATPDTLAAHALNGELAAHGLRLFYHGTRSHLAEMRWLRPVLEQALARCPSLHFEALGDERIARLFHGLPRTQVLPVMGWPAYLAHCQQLARLPPGQCIGLAPLLDSRFNRVRSHTRAFDVARCGALGLFAQGQPYAQIVRHGENGWLLPMQPQAWVEALVALSSDDVLRQQLSTHSRELLALPGQALPESAVIGA